LRSAASKRAALHFLSPDSSYILGAIPMFQTISSIRMFRSVIQRRAAFAATVLLPAAAALAGGGGHDEHGAATKAGVLPTIEEGIVPMIVSLLVVAVVFAVLSVKVWPAISKGLKDREDKIRNSIEEAELAQEQAKQALEQYERNLAMARAEAQKMLDDAKSQQQAISAELKLKAETELNAMREKAKRDIEVAKRAAVAEVHEHATELATRMASKILQREISAQDQGRLMNESLAELQGVGRN
jgi:F-type H+-transporting ATPase subunit b